MARKPAESSRLLSMTGHGRGEAKGDCGTVEAEASSVNRRQLEVRVNIPREMAMLEPMIHDMVGDKVSRGNVSVVVRYLPAASAGRLEIDEKLAKKYVKELRRVGQQMGLRDDLSISSILALPDVVKISSVRGDDGLRDVVKRAVEQAIEGMLAMRCREGGALAGDIQRRIEGLAQRVVRLKSLAKNVPKRYRKSLLERMKRLGVDYKPDDPVVVRELAIFADKADITEEIVRLQSHFGQSREIIGKGGAVGRTLDFLCQEIFREINTIGSKANDSEVSRIVVDFKAELEAIREQVQNVE